MSLRTFVLISASIVVTMASGCPGGGDGPDGGAINDDAGVVEIPYDVDAEAICGTDKRFTPGTSAFVERTDMVGLAGVQGTRLSIGDIDGDGDADLYVRRGGTRADDFSVGGTRHAWLLKNENGVFTDVLEDSVIPLKRVAGIMPSRPYEIVAFADVDNDGDQDLYTGLTTSDAAIADGETSEILLNDGEGVFTLAAADNDVRRAGNIDAPAGATFLDANLDGIVDLFVGEHNYESNGGIVFQSDRLYLGLGDGRFDDVTTLAGLATANWNSTTAINEGRAHTRTWATAACDLNDDGMPDLLAASYGRSPNHLWQGGMFAGTPSYLNRSVASGYAYDDNLTWDDNEFARCYCQSNPTATGCAGVPAPVVACSPNWNHQSDREPYRLGGNSGTTLCGDIDNDGDFDLFTTEIKHWWAGAGADGSEVLVNAGTPDVTFTRPGDGPLGLEVAHPSSSNWDEGHMTAALFDFDNDGLLDLYVGASDYGGNRGLLYHQDTALSFTEVDPADGILHHRSHGVAAADFDRDGDIDVVVGHSRSRCDASALYDCYETTQVRYFENTLTGGGAFLQVALEGRTSNRSAIGARVVVETSDGVRRTSEVQGGHGHYGMQTDMVLHFGLGAACDATVTVTWPNLERTTESYFVPAGHRFKIVEREGVFLDDGE